ncbi:MAG: cysteine desulfurase NifS [Planctomycetota bacterium]|nr:MAG: cysteine desulfurase NifS [Planctomycetota bacterium]
MIYLDNNATTQPLPDVIEAMQPWWREHYGNPSSTHREGQRARFAVEAARRQVAALLGAAPGRIVFTSGGTESINLALRGLVLSPGRRRIVIGAADHAAVIGAAEARAAEGCEIVRAPVDADARLDRAAFAATLDERTALVSLTHVNPETGTIEEIAELASQARGFGARVHVDAVQSAGKLGLNCGTWPIDFLSVSAHKLHGPKGVGALYVADRSALRALVAGGGQEGDLRCGTENVAGIVGFGVAAEHALRELSGNHARVAALTGELEARLVALVPGARAAGGGAPRVGNTTTIVFPGVDGEALLLLLSEAGLCASAGSACGSGSLDPSPALLATGMSARDARGAVRFSLSRFTTAEEVENAARIVREALARQLRQRPEARRTGDAETGKNQTVK